MKVEGKKRYGKGRGTESDRGVGYKTKTRRGRKRVEGNAETEIQCKNNQISLFPC